MTSTKTEQQETTRPWLRWSGLGLVLCVLLILLAHALWGSYSQRRLDAQIAQLHAEGEPMTMKDLPDPGIPDGENASLDYAVAGKRVNEKSAAWAKWSASERAEFELSLTADEAATLATIVSENTGALATVAGARSKRPGGWGDHFVSPYFMSFIDLGPSRALANLLRLSAMDAHTAGRDAETVEHLHDLLRLTDAAAQRPSLIGHLVAMGIAALASDTISDIASDLRIGPGGADRAAVEALLKHLLEERPLLDSRRLGLRTERVFQIDAGYEFLDTGNLPANGAFGSGTGRVIGYITRPLVLQDMRMSILHMQGMLKATEAADWPTAQRQLPTSFPKTVLAHPFTHVFARIMLPSLDRAVHTGYRAIAERRLAALALAIRLYEADHDGQFPAKLDDLIPKYLPAIPDDPMSGRPLKYLASATQPVVYSVGDDGIDDHGKPADRKLGMSTYGPNGDFVVNLKLQPRKPADSQ